jgi:putative ABC transport system substrate-binding protein
MALHQGLQELGYVEDRDYVIEVRSTDGVAERAPALVNDLLSLKVAVIYTSGTPNALAARQVTSEVPIVIATNGDLVAVGLISSLSRPGGNVTGVVTLAPQLSGKRLELLREMVPGIARFGMLVPIAVVDKSVEVQETRTAAHSIGLPLEIATVDGNDALPGVFDRLVSAGVGGLAVAEDVYYSVNRDRVVGLAAQYRLPTIYTLRDFLVGAG